MLSVVRNFAVPVSVWLALAAPGSAAPAHGPRTLDGAGFEQVRAVLGEPDVAQTEGDGALWTWRLDACALMIAFRGGTGVYHVTDIMAGPRHRGDAPISPAQCVAAGEAAQRNTKPPIPAPRR